MPTRDEADYLVASTMMIPEIRDSAIRSLDGAPLFDALLFPPHAMLWDAISKLAGISEGTVITAASVACEVKSAHTSPSEQDVLQEALDLLHDFSTDLKVSDLSPVFAGKILEAFVVDAKKTSFIQKLSDVNDLSGLSEFASKATGDVGRIAFTGTPEIEHPLDNPEEFMPEMVQIPTGIGWMDFLSGGGHRAGDCVGLLGPTGGGKTLTATDMLVSQAKRSVHSLLVTYEQNVKGDVSTRLYTRLLDDMHGDLLRGYKDPLHPDLEDARVDVNFFRKHPYREWPKTVVERYRDLQSKYSRFLHTVDFSQDVDVQNPKPQGLLGVRDIDRTMETLAKQDVKVKYLMVDWLWPAVTRWFYGRADKKMANLLDAAFQFIMELKQLTSKWKCVTILNHQLDTAHTRANPSTQPSCADAWNIKSFAMMLSDCYVIGNRDKESQVMWLGNDKARMGIPQYILGRMDGAMGVIDKTDGYELCRGKFVEKGSAESESHDEDAPTPESRYT